MDAGIAGKLTSNCCYSWLQQFRPRTDGLAKRPTPYDDAFAPKPLRTALAETFANAGVRA